MTVAPPPIAAEALTLGLLAGGRATRLGGADKAWLERDGTPQVLRWIGRFGGAAAHVRVSANRALERYAAHGIAAVPDDHREQGPLGGLHALAAACPTPWLLTMPVDTLALPDDLLPRLATAAAPGNGACTRDAEGLQPLVAVWRVAALREALERALREQTLSVRALVAVLGLAVVDFPGQRFGNLNTPADLAAAGIAIRANE